MWNNDKTYLCSLLSIVLGVTHPSMQSCLGRLTHHRGRQGTSFQMRKDPIRFCTCPKKDCRGPLVQSSLLDRPFPKLKMALRKKQTPVYTVANQREISLSGSNVKNSPCCTCEACSTAVPHVECVSTSFSEALRQIQVADADGKRDMQSDPNATGCPW
jgi:hypothetical protein